MALFVAGHMVAVAHVIRPIVRHSEGGGRLAWIVLGRGGGIAGVTVGLILTLNAVGVGFHQTYDAYFLGLLLFLVIAGTNFVFLLRLLWSTR